MNIREMREGMYVGLTEDVEIGAITLEKDTVFIIEEMDETHFTIRNQIVGWGILENGNAINFIKSNEIEYKRDLDKKWSEF